MVNSVQKRIQAEQNLKRYYYGSSGASYNTHYINAFLKEFREFPEEWVEDTIWHTLWKTKEIYSDKELGNLILLLSEYLDDENSLYNKYTIGE